MLHSLVAMDDAARDRVASRWLVASVLPSLALGAALFSILPFDEDSMNLGLFMVVALIAAGVALGRWLGLRRFRPRFARFTRRIDPTASAADRALVSQMSSGRLDHMMAALVIDEALEGVELGELGIDLGADLSED